MDDHDLTTCVDCYALVENRHRRDHERWHDELDAQIRQVVRDGIEDWRRGEQPNQRG